MSAYRPDIAPVRAGEIVRWVVERLNSSDRITDPSALGGEHVMAHGEEAEKPPRFGVVLQERPAGGTTRTATGVRGLVILVRYECAVSLSNWDTWHDQMHEETRKLLEGQAPDLPHGLPVAPLTQEREPDVPLLDADDRTRYSVSGYRTLYTPIDGYND